MKLLILFFIIVFCTAGQRSYCQWIQTNGPQGGAVNCMEKVGADIWAGMTNGIYRSSNEGQSWQKLPVINAICSDIYHFNDTIVVIYQERIGYQSPDVNIYSITSFNAGATWTTPSFIDDAYGAVESIKIVKAHNKLFIKSEFDYYQSSDWGANWNLFSVPFGDVEDLQANSNNLLLNVYTNTPPYGASYLSVNAGQTWQYVDSTYQTMNTFVYGNTILFMIAYADTVMHYSIVRTSTTGTNWDTVFTSPQGINLYSFAVFNGKLLARTNQFMSYSSSDSGATWTSDTTLNAISYYNFPDMIILNNGDVLCYKGYGQIERFVPSQNTFLLTHTGIASQATYLCRQHANVLYASTYYALFRSADAGQTWMPTNYPVNIPYSSDPAFDIIFKGDTIVAVSNEHMGRSFDNGITWDTLPCPGAISPFYNSSLEELNGRLYYSGDAMFYSDDLGVTWDSLPPLPLSTNCSVNNTDTRGFIKVYRNILFATSNSGYIFKLNNANQSWDYLYCVSMTGTSNSNYLYEADSLLVMAGRAAFVHSADNGITWTTAALNGLPIQNFYPIVPRNIVSINGIWFGTCGSYGVYSTNDMGNNWSPAYSGNPPFFSSGGLTTLNNVLFAGSGGNSVWTRGGNFQNISGTVYHDNNNNGIREAGEDGYAGIVVRIVAKGWMATTDSAGNYTITTDAAGDTLKPVLPAFFVLSDPDYYITNGAATSQDFGIYIPPNVADLAVDVTNVYKFVPGFTTLINVAVHNNGSLAQTGQTVLIMDTLLDYISAFPAPATLAGDTLTWQSDTLEFLESQNIQVWVQTPVSASLGDSVNCYASVATLAADSFPSDNFSQLRTMVVSAYDPNDKECVQGEYFSPMQLSNHDEMTFIIRFQNTGNFPATFVNILDTLSPYLDLTTFHIVASSHSVTYELSAYGIASFHFDAINLPPVSLDEPNSHGFVKYAVRCKESVVEGNAIVNAAHIYFDFNTPIATNTTTTLVAYPNPAAIYAHVTNENKDKVHVYPNPANGQMHIELGNGIDEGSDLVILNVEGKIIKKLHGLNAITTINVNELSAGMYLGIIFNSLNEEKASFRFIVNR